MSAVIKTILESHVFWTLVVSLIVYLARAFFPGIPFQDSELFNWIYAGIVAALAAFSITVDVALARFKRTAVSLMKEQQVEVKNMIKQLNSTGSNIK